MEQAVIPAMPHIRIGPIGLRVLFMDHLREPISTSVKNVMARALM
jgi:hypothetical protein